MLGRKLSDELNHTEERKTRKESKQLFLVIFPVLCFCLFGLVWFGLVFAAGHLDKNGARPLKMPYALHDR